MLVCAAAGIRLVFCGDGFGVVGEKGRGGGGVVVEVLLMPVFQTNDIFCGAF